MMTPAYDERVSQQHFEPPQYSSPTEPSAFKVHPERHVYARSNHSQSQEKPRYSPSLTKSRSPSLHFDTEFDAEDADLSQLMNKRMREAKMVKSKLAEQRLATAALESRFAAQAAASAASELSLKQRILELEARDSLRQEKVDEELRGAKAKNEEAERKVEEAATRLQNIRTMAKKGLEDLGGNYASLQSCLGALKSEYNASQEIVQRMSGELADIRRSALDGVKAIEPLLSAEGSGRGTETRALIDELQSDRASAYQVIDMLRDKLHLLSAQVVEARERIAELEAIREAKIERVETKVEELADKLVRKQEEGVRELADAKALEVRLYETSERLMKVSKTLEEKEIELGTFKEEKVAWEWELKDKCTTISSLQGLLTDVAALKEEKVALECVVKEKCSRISALRILEIEVVAMKEEKTILECEAKENRDKIASLEALRNETSTKLLQSQDRVHQQDAELGLLRVQLKSVDNAKEQLESSLEESQQTATKLDQKVRALSLWEAELRTKSGELSVQLSKLSSEASSREEELRQANTRSSVIQDRFDSQALTLKLAKEHSGDLQERLVLSESSHAAKLESTTGKLNVEIAILREQKASLQTVLNQVTEEAATQRAAFLAANVDYEKKLAKQEETHAKLVHAEEQRAVSAEREATDARRLVDELTQRLESGRAELQDAKKKSRESAARESMGMEGEVIGLRARLEEMEGENERLQHRARMLHKRYKDGDLSDSEKSFVNSLMQMSQSIHEQDIVAKENELRRRENMITSLQTRIDTLESTLARLLKERGKEGGLNAKSMVDLSLWMSSSPHSAQKKADPQPTASSARTRAASPTVFVPDTPPIKKSSNHPKPVTSKSPTETNRPQKTFAALDAEDPLTEPDDDMPLSTLGKRQRTPASTKNEDSTRPARRVRVAASRKAETESDKKDGVVKSKQRKRR
ncbi:hypothetical protein B0H10DRAFT_2211632 [Mycena sp. CBHHK59/15]|nr:hypothetical protein B0H10DRAFT_2211632 [Mycena sp. CBHHK59/15]